MAAGDPLLSGDEAKIIVFKGGKKLVEDLLVSASVKPDVTEYKDKHVGNRTYKGAIKVWGWELDLKYHYSTSELVDAMLSYYKALQTPGALVDVWSVMIAVQERNAASKQPGYNFTPFYPKFDVDVGGLEERIMQGLSGFAETWSPFIKV